MATNSNPSGKKPGSSGKPTVNYVCAHCAGKLMVQQQHYRTEFQIGKARLWVTAAQIVLIKPSAHYCDLYMLMPDRGPDVKHVVLNMGIGQIAQLAMPGLVRVHRETIVNLAQVYRIEGTKLSLYHTEEVVVIGDSYRESTELAMREWLLLP